MKKSLSLVLSTILVTLIMNACSVKEEVVREDEVSDAVKAKIHQLGFTSSNAKKIDEGYLVEGDIILHEHDLDSAPQRQFFRIGGEEQYRTNNLVTGLPRVIKISISNKLPSSYVAALDEAIARYNAEGLLLTFQRVSSGANISITKANRFAQYLASAGFPTSTGNPYNSIKVNSNAIGSQPQATVASILAHEIGHCIGFRHTDYMDRSYSCGGATANEGASTVGAVLIPGTPAGPDPNSWMLACIGAGQNRPFNANDKTALGVLY